MFTAVVMEENGRQGWWGMIADRLRPAMPREEERPLPGEGEGFRLIHCPCAPKGRHWQRLERQAGRGAGELVLDPRIPIPKDSGLGRFWPREFFLRLAANTAIGAASRAGVDLSRRRIGLVDREGNHQWLARLLVEEFAEVRVACPDPRRYEAFAREMMEKRGAAVPVTDSEGLGDCLLVLDPEESPSRLEGKGDLLCLAPFQTGEQVVNSLRCPLPAGYGAAVPVGLDPTYFLGAACQLGGREELYSCVPVRCRIGGRDAPVEELAARLRRRDGWL